MKKIFLSLSMLLCFSIAQADILTPSENSNYETVRAEWLLRGGTTASLRNFADYSSDECLRSVFEHVDGGAFLAIKHHLTNYFYDQLVITHSADRIVLDIDFPDDYMSRNCKVTFYSDGSEVEFAASEHE